MKKLLLLLFLLPGIMIPAKAQFSIIKLWPDKIPGAINNKNYIEQTTENEGLETRFSKVTDPALYIYLPPAAKATGTAVLICPGGGYSVLAFDHEGHQVARWLNDNGIAGFILKYRLPSDQIMEDKSIGPLQDAQEAMRIIRRNAEKWNVDPRKVGVIGFSAGGHLASTLSTHYDVPVYELKDAISARPDFSLLIYPVITMDSSFTHMGSRTNLIGKDPSEEAILHFSNELQITGETPPAFLVHSADDKSVPVKNSIVYYEGLLKYGIPSELHIFQKGGHGYGLAVGQATQSAWPELCLRWLKASGF
jgi:acetyl esterase/lipase